MTIAQFTYNQLREAMRRNQNRRMCYELLCQFFDRSLDEGKLETAQTILEILDGFYKAQRA